MIPAARESFAAAIRRQRLPYDARVEYLQSDRNQYINTGIGVLNHVISTEIDFAATEVANDRWVFGNYNSQLGNNGNYLIGAYSGWNVYVYGTQYKPSLAQDTARHTVKINVGTKTMFDSMTLHTGNLKRVTSATSDSSIWLFASHKQYRTAHSLASRIYSCVIHFDGMLVRDLVPVRFTNEQGQSKGAMYDRVSGQLFANAGTGSFVIGPDLAGGGGMNG